MSQFPPETRYVKVNGAQVGYQVVGDGPIDLVFASGLGNHIDLAWDLAPAAALTRDLASISRYIVFDRRGTGVSDPISRDTATTWEDWTEDIRAVLDAVDSRRAAVMAATDTATMAILFAATQPERVSRLVLVNAAARNLQDDDYPFGMPAAGVDALVGMVEQAWGTSEFARASFRAGLMTKSSFGSRPGWLARRLRRVAQRHRWTTSVATWMLGRRCP